MRQALSPKNDPLERFQEKCAAVFRSEPRQNKKLEHFPDSAKRENALSENLRFWRALIARPKHVGALAPSGRALARAIAQEIDPACLGRVLELGPGTGAITQALLERGISPERLTLVEYDPELARAIGLRFPGVEVIRGDAFDLASTLDARQEEAFAGIVSGIPLLNFSVAQRCLYVEGLMQRLQDGASLIQFSYGMHAPAPAPAGHSVNCTALIWANLPPARVWVYRKI